MRKARHHQSAQHGSLTSNSTSSAFMDATIPLQTRTNVLLNSEDMYAPESIELLQKSGIDFSRHEEIGILPNDFAELMITSGMVLSDETKWISFHRCVGCFPGPWNTM